MSEVTAPRIRGVGLVTGWGDRPPVGPGGGVDVGGGLVPAPTPSLGGDRFRRATRECLLAVAAARAAVADAGLDVTALAGDRTGILYVTATGYAAANRAFLVEDGSTLHFPYTAPSAVPGEVTIEFGIRGPYVNLMGGGSAALQGLWCAAHWLAEGVADRVLLLAVEAVQEVRDLFARARRLYAGPLIEGAACLILERGGPEPLRWSSAVSPRRRLSAAVPSVLRAVLADRVPRVVASAAAGGPGRAERALLARRTQEMGDPAPASVVVSGEALACGPLIGLVGARVLGLPGPWLVTAAWRNDYGAVLWPR